MRSGPGEATGSASWGLPTDELIQTEAKSGCEGLRAVFAFNQ